MADDWRNAAGACDPTTAASTSNEIDDVYRPTTTSTKPLVTQTPDERRNIHAIRAEKVLCACLGRGRVQAVSTIFKYIGSFIGKYPYVFIVLTLLFTVLSAAGGYRFHIYQDLASGYTPADSPAALEFKFAREFYATDGEPYFSAIYITANDNGSLLRSEYLDAISTLHQHLQYNLSATTREFDRSFRLSDICGVYCLINEPVWRFKSLLELRRRGQDLDAGVRLDYPISSIYGLTMNLAPYFYGVSTNASIGSDVAPTTITHVAVIVLWYPSSEKHNKSMERLLEAWELAMDRHVRSHYPKDDGLIRVLPQGSFSVSNEVLSGGMQVVPYYSLGFAFMLVFIAVTVSAGAVYHSTLSFACVTITLAAVFSPCLAAAATFGVFTWANLHTNVMMLIAPFLILAIGVDDAFLLVHAWQRVCITHSTMSRGNKLGIVCADVGPSILITSVTNSVAFTIGAVASPPEIMLFCASVAAAMAMAFIYQITLFCPTMMLTAKDEVPATTALALGAPVIPDAGRGSLRMQQIDPCTSDEALGSPTHVHSAALHTAHIHSSPNKVGTRQAHQPKIWQPNCKTGMRAGLVLYAKFVTAYAGRVLALCLFASYMVASIIGITLMKAQCVPEETIPTDSPLVDMFHLRHNVLWKAYHPVSVIINNELDYSNNTVMTLLQDLITDLETAPDNLGANFTQIWLRQYRPWRAEEAAWDVFADNSAQSMMIDMADAVANASSSNDLTVKIDKIDEFLSEDIYAFYKSNIVKNGTGESTRIYKFIFTTAFANVTSLRARAYMVTEWRAIIAKYKHSLNATLYDPDAPYSDIVLLVRGLTVSTLLITMLSMGFVCLFFIPNIACMLVAMASIASICSGVMGFLYWWGSNLDPVTMADLIMAVGFSVDYTAHVSYHYYSAGLTRGRRISRAQRMHNTLAHVLYPMLQASGSTAVCMIPQIMSPMPAHILFVKTVLLVVAAGLLHGLFFVPVILGMLPDQLTGANWLADNSGGIEAKRVSVNGKNCGNMQASCSLHEPIDEDSIQLQIGVEDNLIPS